MDKQKRTIYFDYLRVMATLAVIMLHMYAQNWYVSDVNGYNWQVFNLYDSIVRWGVPVFVMISGALFLKKELSLKVIYTKYIFRMAVSLVVWSAIYALFRYDEQQGRLINFISAPYHLWFIFMIIGLYMMIPILKKVVENMYTLRYFLFMSFIFVGCIPELITIIRDFCTNSTILNCLEIIEKNIKELNIAFGYSAYFVLGFYLSKIEFNKKQRKIIYILGCLGFIFTIVMDSFVALKNQQYCSNYYNNFMINVMMESIAIFVFFKYRKFKNDNINKGISYIAQRCFGIYLVHVLLIKILKEQMGINTMTFNALLSVPVITILVFSTGLILSIILNKIPYIKKYIV